MIDPILDQAHEWNDSQAFEQKKQEEGYSIITKALYGDEKECAEMLKRLEISEEEYRDGYESSPEQVAEEFYDKILDELDDEAEEYKLDRRLNR